MHRDPVDFRIGINGLSILVEHAIHLNPMISVTLSRFRVQQEFC
ncbi:hypothetical protein [Burkholderia gladioli]